VETLLKRHSLKKTQGNDKGEKKMKEQCGKNERISP